MPGTLTVACKLPNGYMLEVYGSEKYHEPVMGGGTREVLRAVKSGRAVKLNGFAVKVNAPYPHEIRHGIGLTHGVDADFYYAWLDQHKDDDLVTKGFIYAAAKSIDVEAKAKELRDQKSGLEPLDRNNPPPEFRKITPADKT